VHGVIWKSGRGVPAIVLQEELGGNRADAVRGTVKVAVLKEDSESYDLIIASCYDQKPFYMLTHSATEVTWVEHVKRVYSYMQRKVVDFIFLRWSLSHEYNFEMNDNDVVDQLRLLYRLQRLQRNQKWWWALWMWALEVSMVNAYMMLRRYCELKGVGMPYSHHEFNEKIGYALLNPGTEWPKRNGKQPPEMLSANKRKRISPVSTPQLTPTKKARAPKLNRDALSPNKGRLKVRLDKSMQHLPVPTDGKGVFQLHHWAHNMRADGKKDYFVVLSGVCAEVAKCSVCRVQLCMQCYAMYHTCDDLTAKIDTICVSSSNCIKSLPLTPQTYTPFSR